MPLLAVTAHSARKFLKYRAGWAESKGDQKKETRRGAVPTEGRRLGNNKLQRLILKGDGERENGPEVATRVLRVWVGYACLQPPVCRSQR